MSSFDAIFDNIGKMGEEKRKSGAAKFTEKPYKQDTTKPTPRGPKTPPQPPPSSGTMEQYDRSSSYASSRPSSNGSGYRPPSNGSSHHSPYAPAPIYFQGPSPHMQYQQQPMMFHPGHRMPSAMPPSGNGMPPMMPPTRFGMPGMMSFPSQIGNGVHGLSSIPLPPSPPPPTGRSNSSIPPPPPGRSTASVSTTSILPPPPGSVGQEKHSSLKKPIGISLPGQTRSFKRAHDNYGDPEYKRQYHDSSPSFRECSTMNVQLNSYKVNISKLDPIISRIMFEVSLIQKDDTLFKLNQGLTAVSGDANRQMRRLGQCILFREWFWRASKQFFKGSKTSSIAAFDGAETFYVASSNFSGGLEEHNYKMGKEDFKKSDWEIVSKLSRQNNPEFDIRIKHIGEVYTKSPQALTEENRPELTRCVETITNQVLHSSSFLLYNTGTYPAQSAPLSSPDEVTEIKQGFSKTTRIVKGDNGEPEAILTVDIASSAFFKSTSFLAFFCSKLNGSRGGGGYNGGRGRDSYGRRDHNGHSNAYQRGQHNGKADHEDYDTYAIENLDKKFAVQSVSPAIIDNLRKAVRRLECMPIHLKNAGANRSILVDGVHQSSARTMMIQLKNGSEIEELSVEQYFLNKYSIRLKYPNLPLVVVKRRKHFDFYPMELLFITEGQRVKGAHMTPEIQAHMTGRNSTLPRQFVEKNQEIMDKYLKLGVGSNNKYLTSFHIKMESSQPIRAKAKILAPPSIEFAESTCQPELNTVSIPANLPFVDPAVIKQVVVINYDKNFRDVGKFCDELMSTAENKEIRFGTSSRYCKIKTVEPDDTHGTRRILKNAAENNVTIVIGIAYEKRPDVHDIMKYFEELYGQQTMQITTDTARKFCNGQGGRQTVQNVLRKFNPKCGGTNFYTRLPERIAGQIFCKDPMGLESKLYNDTQFIGFEMSHAEARTKYDQQKAIFEGDPTCVGVAYSLTRSTKLGGFSYFQDTRLHKLTRLEEKFETCLSAYEAAADGKLPKTIVIFRVGSGEGDYKQVVSEVEEMKKVAEQKFKYSPKFVVILAQRNSHVRIFPANITGSKAVEQNVPSGCCVDTIQSAHGLDEFILCCQKPLIGTARPTRYTIIVNDAEWSKNEVMNVTYHLAFGHQVSFAPPAVPNILYAASNLAKRGHNNYKTHMKLSDRHEISKAIMEKYELGNGLSDDALVDNYIAEVSDAINKLTINGRNFWA